MDLLETDMCVIDIGGLGINVNITARCSAEIGSVGDHVKLYTYTQVAEDTFQLYGFSDRDELDMFKKAIVEKYESGLALAKSDTLTNDRQIGLAMLAKEAMLDAKKSLEEGFELDLVTIDLQKAWNSLKEITGEVHREDLLDEIFSRFCLGK